MKFFKSLSFKPFLFAILLLVLNCKSEERKIETSALKTSEVLNVRLWEINKYKNNFNVINKVVEISKDTLIICKYIGGIGISTDAGETWKELSNSYFFDDIVFDKNKNLIAINHWVGIHERSYSKLFISKDFGENWEQIDFDIKKFFPVKIVSKNTQNLELMTYDSLIYKLDGLDYKSDWKTSKDRPHFNSNYEVFYDSDSLKFQYNSHNYRFYSKFDQVNDIVKHNNKIYLSGSGDYKDERYTAIMSIVSDRNRIKEFFINEGSYAYLTKSEFNNLYVFGDFGVYKVEEDTIKKLY